MQKYLLSLLSLAMLSLSSLAVAQSATLKIGDVVAQTGSKVSIPVYADFSETAEGISGFDLYIHFDSSELGFLRTDSLHPLLAEAFNATLRANNPEVIQISWIDFSFANPLFIKDTLFYLQMQFIGNDCSTLGFFSGAVQSELINPDGMEITGVSYTGGSVCSDSRHKLIIQVSPEDLWPQAQVSVNGNPFDPDLGMQFIAGEYVTITTANIEGFIFDGWSSPSGHNTLLSDTLSLSTSFVMPVSDISFTAHFTEKPPPVFSITFIIQNQQGSPIGDARITLNDEGYAKGEYLFTDLQPGTYTYDIKKEGYFDASGVISVDNQDVVETVTMIIDDTHTVQTEDPAFRIYPNPANVFIHIETGTHMEQVLLINAKGQLVKSAFPENTNACIFPVAGLAPGVYFIRVLTKHKVYTKPLHLVR